MTKTCVNCRWEPVWETYQFNGILWPRKCFDGVCKAPVPNIVIDFDRSLCLGDNKGKGCKTWEPKPSKGSLKMCRETFNVFRTLFDRHGQYYCNPDISGRGNDTIMGKKVTIID